jgi:hypothetical protein
MEEAKKAADINASKNLNSSGVNLKDFCSYLSRVFGY